MMEASFVYQFGSLTLDPEQISLVGTDGIVHLSPTGFQILSLLVRNAGRIVTKDSILKEVWQERFVEESNITQNIFVLRNILAQHGMSRTVIVNEPGRGYRFSGDVRLIPRVCDESLAAFINDASGIAGHGTDSGGIQVERHRILPANLPLQPTPLIGRERDVSELMSLLERCENRVITLTGGPGSGKTALAARVVAEIAGRYPNGAVFVPLVEISEPDLVPFAVAQTLGLRDTGNQPIADALADYFRDRRMLLVLDNFEQILSAARYVTYWLSRAARLIVLITSRTLLNVRGEQEFPVMPLPFPDLRKTQDDQLGCYPSVDLFLRRARLAQPGFSLNRENCRAVAGICARVDGLPGAIELAAARVRILEPRALLARMEFNCLEVLNGGTRDLARHQQTMRSTVQWSYNLLNEPDRTLLGRLSVFIGGFTIEAAESVCSSINGVTINVLEGIAALRQNSLVWRAAKRRETDIPRFRMLEMVREYGLACLSKADEEANKRKYVAYFRQMAEDAEPRLNRGTLIETIAALDVEAGNILAAMRWAFEWDRESAINIIAALRRYWQVRAYHKQARKWLDNLLKDESEKTLIRAKGLATAGALACTDSDFTSTRALITEGIQLFRDLGDGAQCRLLNIYLGTSLMANCDFAEAHRVLYESFSDAQEQGDLRGVATSLMNLGGCAYYLGDLDGSVRYYSQGLSVYRELDDRWGCSGVLNNLGLSYISAGDYVRAWPAIRESLAIAIEIDYAGRIAECIETAAVLANATGAIATALRLMAAAESLRCNCFTPRALSNVAPYQEVLQAARERLGEDDFQRVRAEGSSMTMADLCEYSLGLQFP